MIRTISRNIPHSIPMVLLLALFAWAAAPTDLAHAGGKVHKVAIHVDDNDPKRMNMALNNAQNIEKYYQAKGEKVEIEIVAYGPGLHMFRADTSPVKSRIEQMALALDSIKFSACGNTHRNMSKKSGKDVVLLSEANKVPSGVVRLMELQQQGWSYIRP